MDRLYVYYEKIRNIVRKRGFLCRLVQGWKVAVVALACYGWWGVIYPELTMLPSTYEGIFFQRSYILLIHGISPSIFLTSQAICS